LKKSGSGSLTFSNNNDNSFSSLVTVSNGLLNFSNNGQNTFLAGITLTGGALTFTGSSSNVIVDPQNGAPVVIIGAGTTLTVNNSGANVFNGTLFQLDGTLAFNQAVDGLFDSSL